MTLLINVKTMYCVVCLYIMSVCPSKLSVCINVCLTKCDVCINICLTKCDVCINVCLNWITKLMWVLKADDCLEV